MGGFEMITGREHDGLVEKCQENGWLKVGGFDWQDDPFLEEYPYEFSRTDSVDRLREALGSGNWAIRQGFCYRDLAFIQQVNGGDEWWALKRDGDGWVDFESVSCEHIIAHSKSDFERLIASMRAASTDECVRLDYLFPRQLADKLVELSEEFGHHEIADGRDRPESFRAYAIDALADDPEAVASYLDEAAFEADEPAARALAIDVRMQMAIKGDGLAERAFSSREASGELDSRNASMPSASKEH